MEIEDKKRKIGIDIDDTLLDFIGNYLIFHNQKYKTNLKREDFKTYSFNHSLGGTMNKAVNTVGEFYKTEIFKKIRPFSNSIDVINNLKKKYDLFIITSRPDFMVDETKEWINKYFPNKFSDIFFSYNHYTKRKNNGKTKAEICSDLEISILIDDSLEYALNCAEKGVKVLLLNARWNLNGEHENIIRVKNWEEILEKLKEEEK